MAKEDIAGADFLFPTPSAGGIVYGALGSATAKQGTVFQAAKAGAITKVMIPFAVVGAGNTYRASLQTVSSNLPTGTLLAAGAEASFAPALGSNEITIPTPPTVTEGQFFAVVVDVVTYASASQVLRPTLEPVMFGGTPYNRTATPGGWTGGGGKPSFAYAIDGVYQQTRDCWAIASNQSLSFSTASGTNEVGIKLTMPFGATVGGLFLSNMLAATALASLYRDSTLLTSQGYDANFVSTTGGFLCRFATPANVEKNDIIRATVNTTTGASQTLKQWTFANAELQAVTPKWELLSKTARTGTGAWIDTPLLVPCISLLLNGIGGESNRKVRINGAWVSV